jgi:hypothetical protein
MDTAYLDDFLVEVSAPAAGSLPAIDPPRHPADVAVRYDAFHRYRDRGSRNIVGLSYSWSSPATMMYDWYQTRDGMTVSLEALSTINRDRNGLITLRVRPVDAARDNSICKLGRTWNLLFDDEERRRRVCRAITSAIDAGKSPLWRLGSVIDLPAFVTDVLQSPMEHGEVTGHLDHRTTAVMLMTDLVDPADLLSWLGTRPSCYQPRHREA